MTGPSERFEAKDLLTILAVTVLGIIGYTYDQGHGAFRWLLGSFQSLWLVAYVALAAGCLYGALRYRGHGRWWGVAFAIYLLLMPIVTILGAALYAALTGQDAR